MPSRRNLVTVKGYIEQTDGASAAVSAANEGRQVYDEVAQCHKQSNNGLAYQCVVLGASTTMEWDRSPQAATATLAAPTAHTVYPCDPSGGAFTLTLPDATTVGRWSLFFKHNAASSLRVTLAGLGGQTIDGVTTVQLRRRETMTLFSDGNDWMIL